MEARAMPESERARELTARKGRVVEAAFRCFCGGGIEGTTIEEIARHAKCGAATVYRYFETKENLALACGRKFWLDGQTRYDALRATADFQHACGMEQVRLLMNASLAYFQEAQPAFRFIHDLDGFLLSHRVPTEDLSQYEQVVDGLRPYLCDALEKGRADGSMARREDSTELYYTLTTAIFGTMQKLAAAGLLLKSDASVGSARKVELLIELLLAGLRG